MIKGRDFALGMGLAGVVWTAAFRGKSHFWQKMAIGVGAMGALAVAANPELRSGRNRPRLRDVPVGLAMAAVLYGIFRAGDRFARRVMPTGEQDIADVYERRRMAPRWFIAPALALVIAPGEELFWRGLVNGYLMQRMGRVAGSALGAVIYGGIHLITGNLTLSGAAGIAGAFWSLQYLFEGRLPAVMVSHIAWDLWIFLVQPTVELDD
ncbi:MAG TPA: CPBP family intramembrane glutamic endopeptidase [Candidatus Dormibacteraeota bacterium]